MTDYDEVFAETAASESLFVDKRALDPPESEEIVACEAQQQPLARLLHGVHEGYLLTTASIYGPLGTEKRSRSDGSVLCLRPKRSRLISST